MKKTVVYSVVVCDFNTRDESVRLISDKNSCIEYAKRLTTYQDIIDSYEVIVRKVVTTVTDVLFNPISL